MGQAKKKDEFMVSPAITPVHAPPKRKSARTLLVEKFMGFFDQASQEMSEKELAAAEKKTDEIIARACAASLREK